MDIREVLFGNLQYQISKPELNRDDRYWYQRVRQIARDGKVQDEWIFRSYKPDDQAVWWIRNADSIYCMALP